MAHPLIGSIAAVNFKIIFECMIVQENRVPYAGQLLNGSLLVNAALTFAQNVKPYLKVSYGI